MLVMWNVESQIFICVFSRALNGGCELLTCTMLSPHFLTPSFTLIIDRNFWKYCTLFPSCILPWCLSLSLDASSAIFDLVLATSGESRNTGKKLVFLMFCQQIESAKMKKTTP
jgi:hypothetical protein